MATLFSAALSPVCLNLPRIGMLTKVEGKRFSNITIIKTRQIMILPPGNKEPNDFND
jgi:hypothetical protein